jgi:hypothetical protein
MMRKNLIAMTILSLCMSSMLVGTVLADGANTGFQNGRPFQELLLKLQQLEDRVDGLENENAELRAKLVCISSISDSYDLYIDGCNVHIWNGTGQTNSINNRGNLIVGYNEDDDGIPNNRGGSHNLIIGQEHTYSSYGGLVAGFSNSVTARNATVSGGERNVASALGASVSAGLGNEASNRYASVSGGAGNVASGDRSSIAGGDRNIASQLGATASGGSFNVASGYLSHVSAGIGNEAWGAYSSVISGRFNSAGDRSTVNGGTGCNINSQFSWAVGVRSPVGGCSLTNPP